MNKFYSVVHTIHKLAIEYIVYNVDVLYIAASLWDLNQNFENCDIRILNVDGRIVKYSSNKANKSLDRYLKSYTIKYN